MARKGKAKKRKGGPRGGARKSPGTRTVGMAMGRRSGFTTCTLRAGQIVPDRLIVPMKYVSSLNMNGAAGVTSYVFSQNSTYDPDVTGGGGSCTGWNTLALLYGRYRVLSSKIRITANVGSANIIAAAVAASQINLGGSSPATFVAAMRLAKPNACKVLPVSGGGPAIVLTDEISTSEIVGDQLFDEIALYGVGAADPSTQFYWVLGTNDINGLAYTFNGVVELEYVCEWALAKDVPS